MQYFIKIYNFNDIYIEELMLYIWAKKDYLNTLCDLTQAGGEHL